MLVSRLIQLVASCLTVGYLGRKDDDLDHDEESSTHFTCNDCLCRFPFLLFLQRLMTCNVGSSDSLRRGLGHCGVGGMKA